MKQVVSVLAIVVLLGSAATSLADVQLRHTGVSPSLQMTAFGPGYTSGLSTALGIHRYETSGGAVPGWGFSIELMPASTSQQTYSVAALGQTPVGWRSGKGGIGADKAGFIGELWSEHIADVQAGGAVEAAAFQAAIWEIVYEDAAFDTSAFRFGWDIGMSAGAGGLVEAPNPGQLNWPDVAGYPNAQSSFGLSGNSSVIGLANQWLADVADEGGTATNGLLGLSSPLGQDFVVQISVPGAAILGAFGLGMLVWWKHRHG